MSSMDKAEKGSEEGLLFFLVVKESLTRKAASEQKLKGSGDVETM